MSNYCANYCEMTEDIQADEGVFWFCIPSCRFCHTLACIIGIEEDGTHKDLILVWNNKSSCMILYQRYLMHMIERQLHVCMKLYILLSCLSLKLNTLNLFFHLTFLAKCYIYVLLILKWKIFLWLYKVSLIFTFAVQGRQLCHMFFLPCHWGLSLKGKDFLQRSRFFSFRVDPFSIGVQFRGYQTGIHKSCFPMKNGRRVLYSHKSCQAEDRKTVLMQKFEQLFNPLFSIFLTAFSSSVWPLTWIWWFWRRAWMVRAVLHLRPAWAGQDHKQAARLCSV